MDPPSYEEVMAGVGDGAFEPPPPYEPPREPSAPPPEFTTPPPYVSEEVARRVLLEYSEKHAFFSSKVAKNVELEKSQDFHTHRYQLTTFTESRKWKWIKVPYHGEAVDGPGDRPIPKPWDVHVTIPNMFQEGKKKMRVPHTSSLHTCKNCKGKGNTSCSCCCGFGWRGEGSDRSMCMHCTGSGTATCSACDGQGIILMYGQLTVKWKTNNSEFVADHKSDFPTKRFKKVSGVVVFSDEQMRVDPVTGFHDPSINRASDEAIKQHRLQLKSFKILRQKHQIEWLPLTKVQYSWKNKQYDFFVYGTENKVYADKYPMGVSCVVM